VGDTWYAAPALGPSVVMTGVGGRSYPAKVQVRCKTCMSPYRVAIENALLKSYGYTAIVRSLPEDAGLSVRNIQEHFRNGHLPIDESVRRVLIEDDARERGLDIEGFESTLANHVTFAKLGVQKVMQRMMAGELEPNLGHGIAFANLLLKVEEQAGEGVDMEAVSQGFIAYMEVIRQVCSPEQVQAIADGLSRHPTMNALLNRTSSGPVQAEAIEVETTR
jgi:hypothetical protein